ncbi:MAG: ABC transporter ATP-binding protein, partial [Ethanoligenens sp.]
CCLLGPNGVGKTTLFKTILGFLKIMGGEITLDGESTRKWPQKKLARAMGYVPQAHDPPFPYTVMEVVLLGRIAHVSWMSSPSRKDREIAEHALESLGIARLRDKYYTEISGGERQMVLIARALAQEPEFLVLDEPTSNLDYGNQVRVLQEITQLAEKGLGIVMTTHQPDHVFICPCNVVLLQRDAPFQFGNADTVVTEKNLKAAYGIDVKITGFINEDGELLKTCLPLIRHTITNTAGA